MRLVLVKGVYPVPSISSIKQNIYLFLLLNKYAMNIFKFKCFCGSIEQHSNLEQSKILPQEY